MFNILLVGVGGQGTVLASSILQSIYLDQGNYVKSTETIGMSQMGGSVNSHIRVGEKVYSPFIPEAKADLVFAFEPAEGARNIRYTNKDTIVIANDQPIKPVTDTLAKDDYEPGESLEYLDKNTKLYVCNFDELFEEIGTNKPLNIAMLAYAIGLGVLNISQEEMEAKLKAGMKEKILPMNLRALDYGVKEGSGQIE